MTAAAAPDLRESTAAAGPPGVPCAGFWQVTRALHFRCTQDAGHPPPHVCSGETRTGVAYRVEWLDPE